MTQMVASSGGQGTSAQVLRFREWASKYAIWLTLVMLIVAAQIVSRGVFLESQNVLNIVAQNSVAGTLAVGQTLVILTAGIDLSLGSITALASMVVLLMQAQGSTVARLAGLGVALGCGLINGLLVTKGRVPPFVATLGMMQVALGLAYVVSNGYPVYEGDHMSMLFGADKVGPVPLIVALWVFVVVIAWVITRRTNVGAYIFATGGNERAARVSGIRTDRTKLFVYVFAGFCAGVAAIIWINRLGYSEPNIGASLTLGSIAPVFVGGTSPFGGVGGVGNTVGGVLIMGILINLMVLVGINVNIQQTVEGLIILAVVYMFIRQQRSR